jgi:hypothetical protein
MPPLPQWRLRSFQPLDHLIVCYRDLDGSGRSGNANLGLGPLWPIHVLRDSLPCTCIDSDRLSIRPSEDYYAHTRSPDQETIPYVGAASVRHEKRSRGIANVFSKCHNPVFRNRVSSFRKRHGTPADQPVQRILQIAHDVGIPLPAVALLRLVRIDGTPEL